MLQQQNCEILSTIVILIHGVRKYCILFDSIKLREFYYKYQYHIFSENFLKKKKHCTHLDSRRYDLCAYARLEDKINYLTFYYFSNLCIHCNTDNVEINKSRLSWVKQENACDQQQNLK